VSLPEAEEGQAAHGLPVRLLQRDAQTDHFQALGKEVMPTIQVEESVLTLTSSNLFRNSAYEIARSRRVVSLGVTAAATGTFVTIQSGSDVVAEESPPIVATVMPIIPDNFHFNDTQEPGDKLKVNVRNPTGGTVIHRAIAMLSDA